MSDYINNLAARTLNLSPVVQPRLASLFEPLSVTTGYAGRASFDRKPDRDDLSSSESILGFSSVRPLTSEDDKMRSGSSQYSNRGGIDQVPSSAEGRDTRDRSIDAIIHHPTVTPSAPPIDHSSMVSERDPRSLQWLHAQTVAPYDDRANSSAFIEGETNNFENAPDRGSKARHLDAREFEQSGVLGPKDRVHPAMAYTTHGSPAAIALVQPNISPITHTRKAFAESPGAGEVPPTIHVTIGRVDVRAVFSQPTAPGMSRARQPSAMSLAEYLKQRNEGHR